MRVTDGTAWLDSLQVRGGRRFLLRRVGALLLVLALGIVISGMRAGYQDLGWGGYWWLGFEKRW